MTVQDFTKQMKNRGDELVWHNRAEKWANGRINREARMYNEVSKEMADEGTEVMVDFMTVGRGSGTKAAGKQIIKQTERQTARQVEQNVVKNTAKRNATNPIKSTSKEPLIKPASPTVKPTAPRRVTQPAPEKPLFDPSKWEPGKQPGKKEWVGKAA